MQDSVMDLSSGTGTDPARGMVAQIATLARSFTHDVQEMKGDELEAYLEKLAEVEGDEPTAAARNLVRCLLVSELRARSASSSSSLVCSMQPGV